MYLESSRISTLGVDVRLDSFTVESESNLRLKVVNYLFKKLRLFDWALSTLRHYCKCCNWVTKLDSKTFCSYSFLQSTLINNGATMERDKLQVV